MTTDTLTKKVNNLEQRVAMLEQTIPQPTAKHKDDAVSSALYRSSYEILARLRGLLKKVRGENPIQYQRRIREESDRSLT